MEWKYYWFIASYSWTFKETHLALNDKFQMNSLNSMCIKRFRGAKKSEERDFGVLPARKLNGARAKTQIGRNPVLRSFKSHPPHVTAGLYRDPIISTFFESRKIKKMHYNYKHIHQRFWQDNNLASLFTWPNATQVSLSTRQKFIVSSQWLFWKIRPHTFRKRAVN